MGMADNDVEDGNFGPDDIFPVEFKVLIKPDDAEEQTSGGLLIPEMRIEKQQYAMNIGTVLRHGEGFFKDLPGPAPKIGQRVLYNKHAGALITMDIEGKRTKLRIMNDKDIIAIIGKGKE